MIKATNHLKQLQTRDAVSLAGWLELQWLSGINYFSFRPSGFYLFHVVGAEKTKAE